MSSAIASIHADLTLQYAQFQQGLKRVETQTQQASAKMSTAFNAAKTAAIGMGAAMAGLGLANLVKEGLDYASSLGETAAQLGVSTKSLQEYRYAATQTGVSQETMDKSLAKLTKNMGAALTGNKSMAASFADLGIRLTDASGRARDSGDVLADLGGAIKKINDPAKEAAVATTLLGKSGQELLPMLESGAGGVNALRKSAEDLGIVLTDEMIDKADEAADKFSELKVVLESKVAMAVADNASGFIKLGNAIGWVIDKIGFFFKTMEGVERLKRDDGWLSGMFSSASSQAVAADPKQYLAMRTRNLVAATNARRAAEAAGGASTTRGGNPGLVAARAAEQEAARLVRAAKNDYLGSASPSGAAAPTGGSDLDVSNFSSSGGGGSKKLKAAKVSDYEKELANLKLAGEQLQRNEKDQDLYNSLKAAGVTIDSDAGKKIEALVRANQALEQSRDVTKLVEELKFEDEQLKRTDREQAIYNELHRLAIPLTSELGKVVAASVGAHYDAVQAKKKETEAMEEYNRVLAESLAKVKKEQEDQQQRQKDLAVDLADIGLHGFDDWIHGSKSFGAAMKGIVMDLGDLMLQTLVYQPLRELAAGLAGVGGGGGGILGTILNIGKAVLPAVLGGGNLFSGTVSAGITGASLPGFSGTNYIGSIAALPGRASGGPVNWGETYLVGEQGPEIFTPRMSGAIIPNHALRGGSGATTINSTVYGVNDPHMVRRTAHEAIAQSLPISTRMSVDATFARGRRPQL